MVSLSLPENLTPEQIRDLQVKNALDRLRLGKNTRRDDVLLAQHAAASSRSDAPAPIPSAGNFAHTWDELATACGVDRRTLTNVRGRHATHPRLPADRPDGRKDIAAWVEFLSEVGVSGRGSNGDDYVDEKELRILERKLRVERERLELEKARDELLPIAQFEAALGHMLAKFRQSLDALSSRIASGIDEADGAELIKLLSRAESEGLSIAQLRDLIDQGKFKFADYHARLEFVESEIAIVKRTLVKCDYLDGTEEVDDADSLNCFARIFASCFGGASVRCLFGILSCSLMMIISA